MRNLIPAGAPSADRPAAREACRRARAAARFFLFLTMAGTGFWIPLAASGADPGAAALIVGLPVACLHASILIWLLIVAFNWFRFRLSGLIFFVLAADLCVTAIFALPDTRGPPLGTLGLICLLVGLIALICAADRSADH